MPLNIDIQQILLHMLNFVILFAVLYFLLYKPVKKFMDDREEKYRKSAEEAEAKLKKADEAMAGLDASIAEKDKAASQKRAEMLSDTQEQCGKKLEAATAEAARILDEAKAQADMIRKQAVEQSSEDISKLVIMSVNKAVLSSGEAYDQFLDEVEKDAADEY